MPGEGGRLTVLRELRKVLSPLKKCAGASQLAERQGNGVEKTQLYTNTMICTAMRLYTNLVKLPSTLEQVFKDAQSDTV